MNGAEKLSRLAARFDALMAQPSTRPGSRAEALIRGHLRYLQILGRRLCAETDIQEPLWVNDPLDEITATLHLKSIEEADHGRI